MTPLYDLNKFEQCRILIVGDVMLDRYLWGNVDRISPEAPVPVFNIKRQSEIPGGAGNVVSNLVGLGCSATIIGVRGNDFAGERLTQLLKNERVKTHLLIDRERPTVTKTRIVSHGQQLLRVDEEDVSTFNADREREVLAIIEAEIQEYQAIVISDYGKGLLQSGDLVQRIIRIAKYNQIPTIVDPKGKDWERYRGATCVTPNTKELELVYGTTLADTEFLVEAMQSTLIKYNLEYLVVTRGPLGISVMKQNQSPIFIPTVARQVFDVSGAGDTVIATLALGIGSGLSFTDGAKLANLAAGIVVGKIGTQPINLLELKASLEVSGVDSCTGTSTHKVISLHAAAMQVAAWKANGEKVVLTNGCFDLLHPGHIRLLNDAKDRGDRLIVAVNADASVKRLKGPARPILNERDRASLLAALDCVDLVLLFEQDTPEELIETIRPDILVKGSDYKRDEVVGRTIVESYGGQVHLIPLLEGYSTTAIANKVFKDWKLHNHIPVAVKHPTDITNQVME